MIDPEDYSGVLGSGDFNISTEQLKQLKSNGGRPKSITNSYYGQSIVESKSKEYFKKNFRELLESYNYVKEFKAFEYESIEDVFSYGLRFVREEGGRRKEYSWVANPETTRRVVDSFSVTSGVMSTIGEFKLQGVEFKSSYYIPDGWAVLCDESRTEFSKRTPHPMAVVTGLDDGHHEELSMSIGGQMHIKVFNP